jgi:hypothetical protein
MIRHSFTVAMIAMFIILLFGDQTIRAITAIIGAIYLLPALAGIRRETEQTFWRNVSKIIASPEPPTEAPASEQVSDSQDTPAAHR